MLLSICIPTYKRAICLKKTLNIYAYQIRKSNYIKDIEINISDNGSPDDTNVIVKCFADENKDLIINYVRNNENLGPDKNYIQAMQMAHGDFSILWSDDDYLQDGALDYIIETITKYPQINMFVSNRTDWINGKINTGIHFFMNQSIPSRIFNFNDQDQALLYFSSVISLGGMFTYIPSIIYKTEIIHKYKYDGCLDGTYYSFLFYWWSYLLDGNKLMYLKTSYIDCTIDSHNENFGNGIFRTLVDYEGFIKLSEILKLSPVAKSLFLQCVNTDHSAYSLAVEYKMNKKVFNDRLLPCLLKCGHTEDEIKKLKKITSFSNSVKQLVKSISPRFYSYLIQIIH